MIYDTCIKFSQALHLLLLAIFHTTYQDKIHIQPITDYILIHMYKRVGWNWEEE